MNLREVLEGLYEEHGQLTPEIVRDAARPEDSPLHAYVFDKDVAGAAETYYLDRAHRLIQRCKVRIDLPSREPRYVRAYVAVPSESSAYSYVPHVVLQSQPSKAEAARAEALRRVTQAHEAVEDLDLILSAGGQPSPGPKRAAKALERAASALQ